MAADGDRGSPAVWAVRATWVVLPLLAGPAVGAALASRSAGVRAVATWGSWSAWAVALVAALVPRTVSLTVLRAVAPGAPLLALWTTAQQGSHGPSWAAVAVALTGSLVAAAAVLAPATADAFADGSSYGSERRFSLRLPGRLLVAVPVVWTLTAAGIVTGPLVLGARRWAAGGVLTIVGVAVAGVGLRALHGLSRRWLVFVPAGLVVHDPFGLAENLLLPRRMVTALGPAPVGTAALDLGQGSLGLGLEVDLTEPIAVTTVAGRRQAETTQSPALIVAPARPGAVLEEAAARRFPVGQAGRAGAAGEAVPPTGSPSGAATAVPPPATSSPS